MGDFFLESGSGLDDFFLESGVGDFFLTSGLGDFFLTSGLGDFFLASGLGDFFNESGLLDLSLAPGGLEALALSSGLGGLSEGGVGDRPRLGLGFFGSGSGILSCLDGLPDPWCSFLSGVLSFFGSGLKDFELDLDRFTAGLRLLEREREFFLLVLGLRDLERERCL